MKRLFLICLIFWVSKNFNAFSQTFKIALNESAIDEKSKKLQSLIAVYHYKKQPFEDPLLNGLETKEKPNYFNAVLPELIGAIDTSYAFIYFGGIADSRVLPGYVLTVLVNNRRNDKPCLLWVDRNFNQDLRDDGAPDTFYYNTKYIDITFENPAIKEALYTTRISRFPYNYNPKYLAMLDEYYKENSGNKLFSGSIYSFKEERLNVKAGDCIFFEDSFRIAVKDVNCNGIFNETGIDAIIIGEYRNYVLSDILIPIGTKNCYFERKGKHYDISKIDILGGSLDIAMDTNAKINNSLVVGNRIKKFKFNTTEKKKISIRKFRKKPTYIFVWRFGENDFEKDTTALREIQTKYYEKVKVVTLNYGETPKELKLFQRRNKINWLIGFSSTDINQKLFIEKYPTGILTNKRLRIRQIGISPSELLVLLRNNSF